MAYALGVDVGTTYSAAAIARDGQVSIFQLGTRAATIPTVVALREDGTIIVGDAAERRAVSQPARAAREFKRRLGDPTPVLLGGTPYGAETLVGEVLKAIVAQVSEREGGPPDAIAFTYPASYGPYKKELLQTTLRHAGCGDALLVTEPEAAALHYAGQERVPAGHVIAVYDFGGGTFDAAVLRKTETGFEVLGAPEGIERLGGIDFDHAVFSHVLNALGEAAANLDQNDPGVRTALNRLRDECREAKENLSVDSDVSVPVLLPGVSTEVRLTRAEFEEMIRPRVSETVGALDRAIGNAGLDRGDIDRILMVGGSSRIPLLSQSVAEATGRPVAVDAHPKQAMAMGAAAWASGAVAGGTAAPARVAPAAPPVAPAAPLDSGDAGGPAASPPPASPPPPAAPPPLRAPEPEPVPAPEPAPAPQAAQPPPPPTAPRDGRGGGRRVPRAAMIGVPVAGVLVAALVGAFIALGGDDDPNRPAGNGTETPSATEDASPTETATPPGTATSTPTATATPSPTPTLIVPEGFDQYAEISEIGLSDDGSSYVVEFHHFGFELDVFDMHVHFYFNAVPELEAGTNRGDGSGWLIWGEDRPFDGYGPGDLTNPRFSGSTHMCIRVAYADHSIEPESGNCLRLPGNQ